MQVEGTMQTAVFQASDSEDVTVRVAYNPGDGRGGISFQLGENPPETFLTFPRDASTLQLAEALQFSADSVGRTVKGRLSPFVRGWINTATDCHYTAQKKGFWDGERNDAEMLMLVVSELSEAVEALRKGNPQDEKLPDFHEVEVELADAVIRIMDMAQGRGWRVAEAIEAKMKVNEARDHKHGKLF